MSHSAFEFPTAVFSVEVEHLAPHRNPAPCVLAGRRGAISVIGGGERVMGDVLFIRPGVAHEVVCAGGGINAMYLDGLIWPDDMVFARRLQGQLADIAVDALFQRPCAQTELRQRLSATIPPVPRELGLAIERIMSEPMARLSQDQLARRLKTERTGALRTFKAATGLTFRRYKQWSALQHATRQINAGELVRTAAMDSGFADTAHLTRTFRMTFGLTPSEAAGRATTGAS